MERDQISKERERSVGLQTQAPRSVQPHDRLLALLSQTTSTAPALPHPDSPPRLPQRTPLRNWALQAGPKPSPARDAYRYRSAGLPEAEVTETAAGLHPYHPGRWRPRPRRTLPCARSSRSPAPSPPLLLPPPCLAVSASSSSSSPPLPVEVANVTPVQLSSRAEAAEAGDRKNCFLRSGVMTKSSSSSTFRSPRPGRTQVVPTHPASPPSC